MRFDVITLFEPMFDAVTQNGITSRAMQRGLWSLNTWNPREETEDNHRTIDDRPFGGGPGMVMRAQPIFDALRAIRAEGKHILYMSPRGRMLDQAMIEQLAREDELVILCGHYEGVDQRVLDAWDMEEVSIGDYILTGGELPAMVLIDSVARFIPQVLGAQESATEESIYSGLLECDQYTKPQVYEEMAVPEVLYSGNHKLIHLAQYRNALELTQARRPDLFRRYIEKVEKEKTLTKEERKILEEIVRKTTGS